MGITGLHNRFKTYFVEHLCTNCSAPVAKDLWITSLKVSVFGKATGIQPATLLKMNSCSGFYQGFLELIM